MNFQANDPLLEEEIPLFEPVADLQAQFTDNQWYCHLARQTVFISTTSAKKFTHESAIELAHNITSLAPHLLSSYSRTTPGAPLPDEILKQIILVEEVYDLGEYPDKWSVIGTDIFEQSNLPLLRIRVAALKDGPDSQGNYARILVLSTHSLFEGADAVKLSRSQPITRDPVTTRPAPVSVFRKAHLRILASILAPLQLLAAHITAPNVADIEFKTLVFERDKMRRVANALDIRQQSLMFALATFALNDGGRVFSKKSIKTLYADLSRTNAHQTNDSFFSFRMIDLKLPVREDFVDYAKGVEKAVREAERGDKSATQLLLNAMFGAHRWMHKRLPFLYTPKLFRFSAGYDLTLSMVPPQRMDGTVTMGMVEPIYSGTYHPGFNMCVFAPGRKYVTFSFGLRAAHMKNVSKITTLFEQLD